MGNSGRRPIVAGLLLALACWSAAAAGEKTWIAGAIGGIETAEYRFSVREDGTLQAPNRVHGFRTVLLDDGFEIVDRVNGAEGFRFSLTTVDVGRPGSSLELERPAYRHDAARAEIDRGSVVEWIENTQAGVKHGFTIDAPPFGEGPVIVSMALGPGVNGFPAGDGAAIFKDDNGRAVVRYDGLTVFDATGRVLPARIELAPGTVRIVVDDADAVYPLTIDPLASTPQWMAAADQAGARFGSSVSTAGDVNNDGFSDVIIGAPLFDSGLVDQGAAFVYLGSAAGLSAVAHWSVVGSGAGDQLGTSVSTAGDVDGDGDDEVLIGVPFSDTFVFPNFILDVGHVRLYRGDPAGLSTSVSSWHGSQGDGLFGSVVAYAGDLNGDGLADFLVASSVYDGVVANSGRVWTYHGDASGTPVAGPVIDGPGGTGFGQSAAGAGDVDGDGFSDLIVGEPFYTNGQADEGRARIFEGSASGVSTTALWTVESNLATSHFGWSVATAGDVDADGYSDVIVGLPFYDGSASLQDVGRALVYRGSASGPTTTASSTLINNTSVGAYFGWSVAPAGDIDGDGFADVIVGMPYASGGQSEEGQARVYRGSPTGLTTTIAWSEEPDVEAAGFGWSVATAGDVNGDGYSDVVVGAYIYDVAGEGGAAFAYLGSPRNMNTSELVRIPGQALADYGIAVASHCDVNGDGYGDLIVGASLFDNGLADQGILFTYHGGPAGPPTTPSTSNQHNFASIRLGSTVACAGDVHNDGYDDVLVGMPGWSDGQSSEGRVHLYRGSANGLTVDALDWAVDGNQTFSGFGNALSRAGDLNGDGFADVIIGAPDYDAGQSNEGAIFVYHGKTDGTGLDTVPARIVEGNQTGANYGFSVAWAGDFNRDGYSDVVVGVPLWNETLSDRGAVELFLGSPTGIPASASNRFIGRQTGGRLGVSVDYGGDFNGDGYSDFLAGAPFEEGFTGAEIDEGVAFIVFGNAGATLFPAGRWPMESNVANANFGSVVAYAGDTNGDGYTDFAIGEPGRANGTVTVWLGSATGHPTTDAWEESSLFPSTRFGHAIGSSDLNGDGFSDLIIGSPDYLVGGASADGQIFFYYGGGGDNLDYAARNRRRDDTGPLAMLGKSESGDDWRIRCITRSPAGRSDVALIHEAVDYREMLDGSTAFQGGYFDSGGVGAGGSDINFSRAINNVEGGPYFKWRIRFRFNNPLFPRSRWIGLTGNGPQEADVRGACTAATWFPDADGDGFGDSSAPFVACTAPTGYVTTGGDCDDDDDVRFPGNPEVCDGVDNDCSGTADDGLPVPSLSAGLMIGKTDPEIAIMDWDAIAGALAYDVTKGDLGALRTSGGDFTSATLSCLANDRVSTIELKDLAVPDPTVGFWYLVRGVGCMVDGSYDSGGSSQVETRDVEIDAQPAACP